MFPFAPRWFPLVLTASLCACGGAGSGREAGQGDDGVQVDSSADAGTQSDGADEGGTGETAAADTGDADDVVEIRIEPQGVVMDVVDGVLPPAVPFVAIGTTADGDEIEVPGVWAIDDQEVAAIDASSGELTATGIYGGVVEVSFSGAAGEASTNATIKLHITDNPGGVDMPTQQAFDAAAVADPTLAWAYPNDATVFPVGLPSPVLQWNGGGAMDLYKIHIDSPTFEFTGFASIPAPGRYALPIAPKDVWDKLTGSVAAGDVTAELQRHDGTQAYLPVVRSWTIADADLIGVVYYWEVNQGNVVRLFLGEEAPESFLQKPPGVTCVACHSVSADGSTLVGAFHGGYSPWGTFATGDGASIYATDLASGFEAISPEGDHVVWGQSNDFASGPDPHLALSTKTDSTVLATLPTPGGSPVHPAWSPDGTRIAYGVRTDGTWLDFNNSSLWVTDVDTVTPGFANAVQLVPGMANRPTTTYPTWSPDSAWLAFGRATQARTRGAAGELWLTSSDGAIQQELSAACGTGVLAPDQSSACYEPTFMPEARGGYFWLVFVSERVYGNTLVDTDVTTRRKQLWVTAIDETPVAGVDPSHPAFWLPGQELDNHNMRGMWTLEPPDGEG
ncbi:MAG TPA: hypothetical protein VFG69_09325 [Nannocystaceae bacterium]|nr:hypothetical protein [Nannocystaceae bacterium]